MKGNAAIFAPEKPRPAARQPFGIPMQDFLSSPLVVLIPMGLIFYLLLMRPQQQRDKQRRTAIDNLRRGDTVITAGGLVARVAKAPAKEDAEITLEISDGVQIKVIKATISDVRAKTQPVDAKSDKG
jgi:preprotein translocase subunit YajC